MKNDAAHDSSRPDPMTRRIPKVSTGIAGLDDILEGGFPEGQITVVSGGPGAGKTILGLEFVYRSAHRKEPAVFVSFEERADTLRRNALSLGWDIAALEKDGLIALIDSRPGVHTIQAGDFDLTGLLSIIAGQAKSIGAKRLVIDAIDVLLRVFADPAKERHQMNYLSEWLIENGFTTVLTSRLIDDPGFSNTNQFLEYMTDCLIRMDMRVVGQIATRRLRVTKYRGSGFGSNEYPCIITRKGMRILPISKMILFQGVLEQKISSGSDAVDEIIGGGFWRGSSVMIAGSSGIGKTTLLCTFAQAACERGDRVLYVSFEESIESIAGSMRSIGIDLQKPLADGTLEMINGMPESMGAEEHLVRILEGMDGQQPNHLIVDAVSATLRIGSRQAAFEFLMRLISICKEKGITCLVSNQDSIGSRLKDYGGLDISTLMDTILLLRYEDCSSEVKRILFALKSRGMRHSNKYHEYRISDAGIGIIGPYAPPRPIISPERESGTAWQAEEAS